MLINYRVSTITQFSEENSLENNAWDFMEINILWHILYSVDRG